MGIILIYQWQMQTSKQLNNSIHTIDDYTIIYFQLKLSEAERLFNLN